MKKAEMETDAMKKQTMTAECDAMAGDAMKADPIRRRRQAVASHVREKAGMRPAALHRRPRVVHSRQADVGQRRSGRPGHDPTEPPKTEH